MKSANVEGNPRQPTSVDDSLAGNDQGTSPLERRQWARDLR
jgi:hypothetical protein